MRGVGKREGIKIKPHDLTKKTRKKSLNGKIGARPVRTSSRSIIDKLGGGGSSSEDGHVNSQELNQPLRFVNKRRGITEGNGCDPT